MDQTTRRLLLVTVVLVGVALVLSTLVGGMMGPGMMGWSPTGVTGGPFMHGPGWMWGIGAGLGGLVMIAFWGALIVGVVLLLRALGSEPGGPAPRVTPLDVVKRRYAAGEITREQYEQMRKDLEG